MGSNRNVEKCPPPSLLKSIVSQFVRFNIKITKKKNKVNHYIWFQILTYTIDSLSHVEIRLMYFFSVIENRTPNLVEIIGQPFRHS